MHLRKSDSNPKVAKKRRGACPRIPEDQKLHTAEIFRSTFNPSDFSKTADMKAKLIQIANVYHYNTGKGILITELKKSTFYDLKNNYHLLTPLQAKRYNQTKPNILLDEETVNQYVNVISSINDSTEHSDHLEGFYFESHTIENDNFTENVPKVKKSIMKEAIGSIRTEFDFTIKLFEQGIVNMDTDERSFFTIAAEKASFESLISSDLK
jgi:hypothetical protein